MDFKPVYEALANCLGIEIEAKINLGSIKIRSDSEVTKNPSAVRINYRPKGAKTIGTVLGQYMTLNGRLCLPAKIQRREEKPYAEPAGMIVPSTGPQWFDGYDFRKDAAGEVFEMVTNTEMKRVIRSAYAYSYCYDPTKQEKAIIWEILRSNCDPGIPFIALMEDTRRKIGDVDFGNTQEGIARVKVIVRDANAKLRQILSALDPVRLGKHFYFKIVSDAIDDGPFYCDEYRCQDPDDANVWVALD